MSSSVGEPLSSSAFLRSSGTDFCLFTSGGMKDRRECKREKRKETKDMHGEIHVNGFISGGYNDLSQYINVV